MADRRQYLWIDPRGADCFFPMAGNITPATGQKGTFAIWQHAPNRVSYPTSGSHFYIAGADGNNAISQSRSRRLTWLGNTSAKYLLVTDQITAHAWELLVYTWDMTGGAGAGVLNGYLNGVLAVAPTTDATPLVGTPSTLRLGPAAGSTYIQETHCIAGVAIWNDAMTEAQALALYREGHRHIITQADGPGTLLFMASFNEHYDADVHAGSGTFTATGGTDRYCLVDDGLREPAVKRLLLGTPRHDFSEDDRVPLFAALAPVIGTTETAPLTVTNNETDSRLQVAAGYVGTSGVGVTATGPWFYGAGLAYPRTYRQRIRVPSAGSPAGTTMRIGPVDYVHYPISGGSLYDNYGSGHSFTVVADGGNSATAFKTDLGTFSANYWAGADVTFLTGDCAGRRLKCTAYDASTKVVTVEGAFPVAPGTAAFGVIDHRARIQGCRSLSNNYYGQPLPGMNCPAWLWEYYGDNTYFTELAWAYSEGWDESHAYAVNVLHYERGLAVLMDGAPLDRLKQSFFYGRPDTWVTDSAFACDMYLERIEVEGPNTYQLLRRDAAGHGPAYADNFVMTSPDGHSTKCWRQKGLARTALKPTKHTSITETQADLQAAGTWRQSVEITPVPVSYDEETETITALVTGEAADGTVSLGYCLGTYNAGTDRMTWVDETPPTGKSNPFAERDTLCGWEKEADTGSQATVVASVLEDDDGWYIIYRALQGNVDHYMAYLLGPCEDRWSFDRQTHWWRGNPFGGGIRGGPDKIAPEGSGGGQWGNRDMGHWAVENPYTKDTSRRFWAWARGKTIAQQGLMVCNGPRPIMGLRGSGLRSMLPLPYGNQLVPCVGPNVHAMDACVYGQSDCYMLFSDPASGAASGGVNAYASEDGVHWQEFLWHTLWLPMSELVGESNRIKPGRPFTVGTRRIYYYYPGSSLVNLASCRVDGEVWYALSSATSGFLETPLIEKPADGWGHLLVNATPGDGTLTVEVLDSDDVVLTGYAAGNCAALTDDVETSVRWGSSSLRDVIEDTIRLRFVFACPSGTSPKLYRWEVADNVADPVVPPTPAVSSHSPTGTGVSNVAPIMLEFSVAMDRVAVEDALSVSPEISYGYVWSVGDTVLTLVPSAAFQSEVEHTVTLGVGATSANSIPIAAEVEWSFTTQAGVGGGAKPLHLEVYGTNGARQNADATPIVVLRGSDGADHTADLGAVSLVETGLYRVVYTGTETEDMLITWVYSVGGVEIARSAPMSPIGAVVTAIIPETEPAGFPVTVTVTLDGNPVLGALVTLQAEGGTTQYRTDADGEVAEFVRPASIGDGYDLTVAGAGSYQDFAGKLTVSALGVVTGNTVALVATSLPVPSSASCYALWDTQTDEHDDPVGAGDVVVRVVEISVNGRVDAVNDRNRSVFEEAHPTDAAGQWSLDLPIAAFTAGAFVKLQFTWTALQSGKKVETWQAKLVAPDTGVQVCWSDLSPHIG